MLCKVFGEGVEPVTDVGDGIPVLDDGWIISVTESECLADGVCQLGAIEAIVMPE